MKRYSIYEIKAINEASGGRFFSRENMKFTGDTLRSFGVRNQERKVLVTRLHPRKPHVPCSTWEFHPETGRLSLIP